MVRGGPLRHPRRKGIQPALHGGVSRRSRFSEFLSCDIVCVGGLKDASVLTSFVFPSADGAKGSLQDASPQMLAALAQCAAALGGAAGGHGSLLMPPPEVAMACIPFIAPGWGNEQEGPPRADANDPDGLSVRARNLQRALMATSFTQAAVATLEFVLNDGISGLIGCCIATLGIQASSPSGYRFLPSYIVLAFCNGTMQVLVSSELAAHAKLLTKAGAVGVKVASVVAIASPAILFGGMAIAWHLHCELRALALQALPSGMRSGLAMPPPIDGVVGASADGAIGQGGGQQHTGPFRPFAGQSHRLEVK